MIELNFKKEDKVRYLKEDTIFYYIKELNPYNLYKNFFFANRLEADRYKRLLLSWESSHIEIEATILTKGVSYRKATITDCYYQSDIPKYFCGIEVCNLNHN